MKHSLKLFLLGLVAVSSILVFGCCDPEKTSHHSSKGHAHGKMHHEHGDK